LTIRPEVGGWIDPPDKCVVPLRAIDTASNGWLVFELLNADPVVRAAPQHLVCQGSLSK
jgi:hypothetical protein